MVRLVELYSLDLDSSLKECSSTVSCTVPSCESANYRCALAWEPNGKGERLKALLFVQIQFGVVLGTAEGLSEYDSVAYLAEAQTWETQVEQYSNTVLWTNAYQSQGLLHRGVVCPGLSFQGLLPCGFIFLDGLLEVKYAYTRLFPLTRSL